MRNLRLWITLLILWLIFLFNIERITEDIDIISYTYIFVAFVASVIVLLPHLRPRLFYLLLFVPSVFFLFFKAIIEQGPWRENLLQGTAFSLTITQLSALILTGLLARQVNHGLTQFVNAIANLTFGQIGNPPPTFFETQELIYQEIKRARYYDRPLTVVALKTDVTTIETVLPYIVKQVQEALKKEYAIASIARTLDSTLKDFEIISLRDKHFLIVLPEVSSHESGQYARRLQQAIQERLNVTLPIGYASLPDNAVTVEGLIDLAIKNATTD